MSMESFRRAGFHQARLLPGVRCTSAWRPSRSCSCRNNVIPPVLERLEKVLLCDFGLDPTDRRLEDSDVLFFEVLFVDDGLDVVKGMAEIGSSRRDCW